jgi:hypothetical protein
MLFREFSIIAAAAYAALRASAGTGADEVGPHLWEELSEDAQNGYMQSVLAIARGEPTTIGSVFDATAKAILDHNGGQGLLALEELMNLGSTVMSLGLRSEDEVSERSIREDVTELLHELAERREGGATTGVAGPAYTDADRRSQALAIAIDRTEAAKVAGKPCPDSIVDAAAQFYDFLAKGGEMTWVRSNALSFACRIVEPGLRAIAVTLVAEDLMTFLEPTQTEDELTETVNGTDQAAQADPALVTH